MKHRFASFTMATVLVTTALLPLQASGQGTRNSGQGNSELRVQNSETVRTAHSEFSGLNSSFPAGQQLVAEAARRVAAEPAISAEMRYKIDAFGHDLVGSGNYLQFGAGPEKLLRLDLRIQLGERPATVQEIRGPDSYWVRRDVPPASPSLGRVDLKQFRKSLASAPGAVEEVLPQGDWIMLGGLARLLTALEQNFAFGTPRPDELQFNSADGKSPLKLPIWTVSGQWKQEKLAALTGREPNKPAPLPPQLPDRVELVLRRTDEALPLFPYRITYWRTPADSKDASPPAPRELLTLEMFKVSNDEKRIDPTAFQYQPGDQEVQNLTQFYVQRYSAESKLR